MFIDHIHLTVQSGSGGNGCESYAHRNDRKHVPDGGDGGPGGDVIFRADHNAPPLSSFRFRQRLMAEGGGHGGSNRKRGKRGKDLLVLVPVGTRLEDRDKGVVIRHLLHQGDEVILIKGGKPGVGNLGGKTVSLGEKGEIIELELHLQLQADVFLVGLPNSGKSSLISALTRSHAKPESYPFSTRTPEVGMYLVSDYERIKFCELPSIYAGSHEGKGVGNQFVRHLESAKLICYVLDPVSAFAASLKEGLAILQDQLSRVQGELTSCNSVVLVNKMDLDASKKATAEENFRPAFPVFFVSAESGQGLEEFRTFLDGKKELRENA